MDDTVTKVMNQANVSPNALNRLVHSKDAQTLFQKLSGTDQGAAVRRAAQSAANGNPEALSQMLQQITQSPDGAALLNRIHQAARELS